MYITRKAEPILRNALEQMPVVALLGPRQCGKTTLARHVLQTLPDSVHLDLEKPDDLRALTDPQAFFGVHRRKLICLDEIQRAPEIFPIIRAEVDDEDRNGRFLILGSASPELLRQSSESLAGRIRYIELTPFSSDEIEAGDPHLRKLWLRGGFPRSFLAKSEDRSFEWRQDFIQTFLERDIPNLGFRIPGTAMRRFWTMLTHINAQVLNRSRLGEALGVSHHTVQHYLDILVDSFLIRSLPPLHANVRKRLVKSPKIFFRDSGILHTLAGIRDQQHLLANPGLGASWESFVLENICGDVRISRQWEFYFYGTHSGGEIDLVLDNGNNRIGVECKSSSAPGMPSRLNALMAQIDIEHSWIVAPVKRSYPISDTVTVGTPNDFIRSLT
jgi:hypothetical protein